MERDKLIQFVQELYTEYDESIPTAEGSAVYTKVIAPLVERFGDDPYTPDVKDFVVDLLQSEFPEMDFTELSAYSDIVVTPFKVIIDPLRREILRLKMAQSLYYKDYLTEEEIEGLASVFQVMRQQGSKARVTVRLYARAPRVIEVNFGASAYTAGGLSYMPIEFYKFTPEQVAQNRDRNYYYVEATFEAVEEGEAYNIGPTQIIGVSGVVGAVWASNPSSATPGTNRETIDEYVDRLTDWVSEHAPITSSGIISRVMELFPAISEIFVVGNGDILMYRDILTYTATTLATLPVGNGTGTLVAWAPGSGTLATIPYAYQITGDFSAVMPPNISEGYAPTKIVINGFEYTITTLGAGSADFDSYTPADCPWGEAGSTSVEYTAPNGCVIPHYVGLMEAGENMSLVEAGDLLLIYNGVTYDEHTILDVPIIGGNYMAVIKGPIEIIKMSPTNADPSETNYLALHRGGAIEFTAAIGANQIDFTATKPVQVGDRLVGMVAGLPVEFNVSYVSSGRLYLTKVDPASAPASPTVRCSGVADTVTPASYAITDADGNFVANGVQQGDLYFDADVDRFATVDTFTVSALILESAEWSGLFAAGNDYTIYGPGNALLFTDWVVYRRADGEYDDDLTPQDNLDWVILVDPSNLLSLAGGTTGYWQARRVATANDFLITAMLPDGTAQSTESGTLHLGGCTDVYMHTTEEASVGAFDGVYDLVPYATALATWTSGNDTMTLASVVFNSDLAAGYPDPTEDYSAMIPSIITLEIDDRDPRQVYRVLALSETGARLSEDMGDSGTNQPVTLYVNHEVDLLSVKNLKKAGTDGTVGFSKYVILGTAAPASTVPGDTLEILSDIGKGAYEIQSLHSGGLIVLLTTTVSGFDTDVEYEIYSTDAGVNAPISRIDHVELRAATGTTAINLYYRDPLACRVMGDSVTDGPNVIIPPDEEEGSLGDYLGSVAHLVPPPAGAFSNSLGLFAWSGDVEEMGVKEGDVLILHGAGNNYSARILLAEYSVDDEQSYILYSPYGYATVDEDDVPFEIHAAQVATVRLYFEHPLEAMVGWFTPALTTIFYLGAYTYSPHMDHKELYTLEDAHTELVIDVSGGATSTISTNSATLDFGELRLKPGDIVLLKYSAIISSSLASTCDVAGKSLTLAVGGNAKTIYFVGTDPLTLDDADGISGQIEDGFGIDVIVRAQGDLFRMYLVSTQKVTVTGGTAVTDLGLLANMTNDTLNEELKGNHTIISIDETSFTVDTVFSSGATGDQAMVGVFIRTGVVSLTPAEMALNTEYGFYYMDVEVQSMQDAPSSFLAGNTYLGIQDFYYMAGFSLSTDKEYSFGANEDPHMYLSPYVVDENGNDIIVARYAFDIHYYEAPVVESVQAVLSSSSVRATADNMMGKQKPLLQVGVGPVIYTGDTDAVIPSAQARIRERVIELVTSGRPVRLSDILGVLTPLGIDYDADTMIFWYYEDLERNRHLRFGDELTVDRTWRVEVPSSMIIFAGS